MSRINLSVPCGGPCRCCGCGWVVGLSLGRDRRLTYMHISRLSPCRRLRLRSPSLLIATSPSVYTGCVTRHAGPECSDAVAWWGCVAPIGGDSSPGAALVCRRRPAGDRAGGRAVVDREYSCSLFRSPWSILPGRPRTTVRGTIPLLPATLCLHTRARFLLVACRAPCDAVAERWRARIVQRRVCVCLCARRPWPASRGDIGSVVWWCGRTQSVASVVLVRIPTGARAIHIRCAFTGRVSRSSPAPPHRPSRPVPNSCFRSCSAGTPTECPSSTPALDRRFGPSTRHPAAPSRRLPDARPSASRHNATGDR